MKNLLNLAQQFSFAKIMIAVADYFYGNCLLLLKCGLLESVSHFKRNDSDLMELDVRLMLLLRLFGPTNLQPLLYQALL